MIRKLRSGEYRLYSRKVSPKTGKRRNLGTFKSRAAAEKHERAVQYFKRHQNVTRPWARAEAKAGTVFPGG
jgi:hypothetical protein